MSTLNQCNGSCEFLLEEMRKKFERNELTDIIVKYGKDGEFEKKAHRLVLCSSSKFFDNALSKHAFKEETERAITLPIENKNVAEVLLGCIYGANYDDRMFDDYQLFVNIDIYTAADYVDLPAVRKLAAQKFKDAAVEALNPKSIDIFIAAAKRVYNDTPSSDKTLRSIVARLCIEGRGVLFKSALFKPMLIEVPELAADMIFEDKPPMQSDPLAGKFIAFLDTDLSTG